MSELQCVNVNGTTPITKMSVESQGQQSITTEIETLDMHLKTESGSARTKGKEKTALTLAVWAGARPMESSSEMKMAVIIRQSLATMPKLEAKFIQECHLMGKTRKHFASENGLSAKSLATLQSRAFAQLKESLAEKNIQSMGDVL